MRTFKNVFGKLIGLALLSCVTFSAIGQSSKNVDLSKNRDDHKVRLYVSPFNLFDPTGNSLQLTAGKSFWNQSEVQLSVSQRLGQGNPSFYFDYITLGLFGTESKIEKGTRVGLEVQQAYYRAESVDFYVGIEGAYSHDVILVEDFNFFAIPISIDQRINKIKSTINGKIGFKFYAGKRLLIDLYAGLGVNKTKLQDAETRSETETVTTWNLPWNVKFGYQI